MKAIFRVGNYWETAQQAAARRIAGLLSIIPAGIAYYFALMATSTDVTGIAALPEAAGFVLFAALLAFMVESGGRAIVAFASSALVLVYLIVFGLWLTKADPARLWVSGSLIIAFVALGLSDLMRVGRSVRRPDAIQASWHAVNETVRITPCGNCGRATLPEMKLPKA